MEVGTREESEQTQRPGNGLKEARAVRQGVEEKELQGTIHMQLLSLLAKGVLQSGPISLDTGAKAGGTLWQQDCP